MMRVSPPPAPPVSVVMPVRNCEAHLDEAISSIQTQSFADFECIIVDDGSTDRSLQLALARAATDRRIRAHSQAPTGIAAALNRGVALANGPLIARMDADDVAEPARIGRQVGLMRERPGIGAMGSGYTVIDARGRPLRKVVPVLEPDEIRARLLAGNCMAHPTMMMRRDIVVAAGGYRAAFPLCEDYDLWLRLSEMSDLANLAEPLLRYREHAGQATWQDLERRIASEIAVLCCARRRRSGMPEPETLTECDLGNALGMTPREIRRAVRARAMLAAGGAISDGAAAAGWSALRVAARQGIMPPRVALRWARLALRWALMRRALPRPGTSAASG